MAPDSVHPRARSGESEKAKLHRGFDPVNETRKCVAATQKVDVYSKNR